jgi:hypothetical protein
MGSVIVEYGGGLDAASELASSLLLLWEISGFPMFKESTAVWKE